MQFQEQEKLKDYDQLKNEIIAFDIDHREIRNAKESIQQAQLSSFIELQQKDALTATAPSEAGVVFCNPPYGVRIDDLEEVKGLYIDYTENLKQNFKGYSAYIFTGIPEVRKSIKLKTSERTEFFNGKIDSRLFRYDLF